MNAKRLLELFELHADKNNIALNAERGTADRVVEKLLINDEKYGQRLCPCRHLPGIPIKTGSSSAPAFITWMRCGSSGSASAGSS